ncbi:MAG: hypothetical protein ACREJK_10655 [Candidatus Methylomirabilales bacterium]
MSAEVFSVGDIGRGSARDLLAAQGGGEDSGGALGEAEEFLREVLDGGPVPAKQVIQEAKEAGISEKTLRRAASRLGVGREKKGMAGPWVWTLPRAEDGQPAPDEAEGAQPKSLSTFESFEHLREAMAGLAAGKAPVEAGAHGFRPADKRSSVLPALPGEGVPCLAVPAAPRCEVCGRAKFQVAGDEPRCVVCEGPR